MSDEEKTEQLKILHENIGLAFQIQDDILDITSTTEELGKNAGSDETSDKTTYPSFSALMVQENDLQHHHHCKEVPYLF